MPLTRLILTRTDLVGMPFLFGAVLLATMAFLLLARRVILTRLLLFLRHVALLKLHRPTLAGAASPAQHVLGHPWLAHLKVQ